MKPILLILLLAALGVHAAEVTVFAGGGKQTSGRATDCRLADPFAVDFDGLGNAFICEMTNNRVARVDPQGNLSLFAGTMHAGSAGDGGPAIAAQLNSPHHLLVDWRGDVLIADSWNWKIRRVDTKTGTISTFAGTGIRGFGGDGGAAEQAQFSGIYCLALDGAGENLYLADLENRRIRAINVRTRIVRTVAGNGERGVPANGSDAATSPLLDPRAVAVGRDGDVYILERSGNALRVVDRQGRIRTVVGTGKPGPAMDTADALAATLRGPKHLCVDFDQNVLIADSDNDVIRKYLPREHSIIRLVGSGTRGPGFNADPLRVQLLHPHGVNVDRQGTVFVCDSYNGRVLRVR